MLDHLSLNDKAQGIYLLSMLKAPICSLETKFTQDYLNIHRMPISSCQLRPDGRISHPELPATSDATKCRQPVVKIEYGDEPQGFPYLIMVCSQRRIWR